MNRFASTTIAALLLAGSVLAEEVDTGGAFDRLVGFGGTASLTVDPYPDGTKGGVSATSRAGTFQKLDAHGSVRLLTDTFDLRSRKLEMDVENQILIATGSVELEQQGITAKCERLEYRIEERRIFMTGSPQVTQDTETGRMTSSGMEEIVIRLFDDGTSETRMERGRIKIEIEQRETEPTTTPAASDANGEAGARGMASLGRTTRIDVSPRGEQPSTITLMTTSNELERFRALGSVLVKTEDFDLRADQLEFASAANTMTALHNVFLRQQGIEADAGRLLYDIGQAVMTLSVNPVVRQDGDGGRTVVSRTEQIVLRRGADGETLAEFEGTPKFDFQPIQRPTPQREDRPSTGPVEILLEDRSRQLPQIPAR